MKPVDVIYGFAEVCDRQIYKDEQEEYWPQMYADIHGADGARNPIGTMMRLHAGISQAAFRTGKTKKRVI